MKLVRSPGLRPYAMTWSWNDFSVSKFEYEGANMNSKRRAFIKTAAGGAASVAIAVVAGLIKPTRVLLKCVKKFLDKFNFRYMPFV